MSIKMYVTKFTRQALIVLVLLTLLLTLTAGFVSAAPPAGEVEDPIMGLIYKQVALWGFGAVIAVLLEILKRFGLLPDGWAGTLSILLNLAVYVFVTVSRMFGYDPITEELQLILQWAVKIGELILAIFSSSVLYRLGRAAEAVKPVPLSRRLGYNR